MTEHIFKIAKEMSALLEASKPLLKKLHDDAEELHDSPGTSYMEYYLFEHMQNAKKLIEKINKQQALLAELEKNK